MYVCVCEASNVIEIATSCLCQLKENPFFKQSFQQLEAYTSHLAGKAEVVGGAVESPKDGGFHGRVPHGTLTESIQSLSGG